MSKPDYLRQGIEKYAADEVHEALLLWCKGAEEGDLECAWKPFEKLFMDGEYDGDEEGVAGILLMAQAAALEDPNKAWWLGLYYTDTEGNEVEGLKWFKICARKVPSSGFKVGTRFAEGDGLKKDLDQAIQWWSTAANQDANCSYLLAEQYQNGRLVPADLSQAIIWWRKGAELKDPRCMNKLAFLYAKGHGVEKDLQQAVMFWEQAASLDLKFCFDLGMRYLKGDLLEKDEKQAEKWITLAAKEGHLPALEKCRKLGFKT